MAAVTAFAIQPQQPKDAARAPAGLQVYMILDNYATHKHETVNTWLANHPRFHLHFTPTSCSWCEKVRRGRLTLNAITN